MSAAEPFLPARANGIEPDAEAVREDDTDRDAVTDPARPARFDTPRPGDRLDADELRRDLGTD